MSGPLLRAIAKREDKDSRSAARYDAESGTATDSLVLRQKSFFAALGSDASGSVIMIRYPFRRHGTFF